MANVIERLKAHYEVREGAVWQELYLVSGADRRRVRVWRKADPDVLQVRLPVWS